MDVLEVQHVLNAEEEQFVAYVCSDKFPFFYTQTTEDPKNGKLFAFTHTLMKRDFYDAPIKGAVSSGFYSSALKLFNRFCVINNVKYSTIHRAGIHVTYSSKLKHGGIHVDHNYPHYNFIMYLNDFSNGFTYLFDDNETVIKEILPEKNKVAVFEKQKHAQGFCDPGERRMVLVFTFS